MDLQRMFELDQRAREEGRRYSKRRQPYFDRLHTPNGKHFMGVVGPRGAGKTVLLKQLSVELKDSCYLSIDTLDDLNLFDVVKTLAEKYKIKILLLDEIHFQKNFEGALKQIFDTLDVRVIFTSSAALAMTESAYDLSRRVELMSMFPFSLREYISFKSGVELPALTIADIVEKKWLPDHLRWRHAFEEYIKGGLHPFALEEPDLMPLLKNILQKVIQKDVTSISRLATDEIQTIEKVVAFVGRSVVDGVNYSSIAKNVGITKYKAEQYVKLLQKSFILNPVFPRGTNVLKEPKVLMCLPYRLLYKSLDDAKGALREDFFAEAMAMAGKEFFYLKSTRGKKTPDFLVLDGLEDMVLEVGGKGKGRQQFKGYSGKKKIQLVDSDDSGGNKRPLHLLGYLL